MIKDFCYVSNIYVFTNKYTLYTINNRESINAGH